MAGLVVTKGPYTIPYVESAFQSVSLRPEAHSIVRHVQVAGGDEIGAGQAFLGWSEYDAGAGKVKRFPPETHPRYGQCVAKTWDFVQPMGEPAQDPAYSQSLNFGGVEYSVGYEHALDVLYYPDGIAPPGVAHEGWRYCSRRQEFETSSISIPKNVLKFFADDKEVPAPGVMMVFEATWFVTWLQVPMVRSENRWFLPGALPSNINMTVMRTNSVEWDGWPPDTLLVIAPKVEVVPMSNQELAANITYPMLVRGGFDLTAAMWDATGSVTPNWRRLIRGDGLYYRIYRTGPGIPPGDKTHGIYETADYQWLFRVDAPPFAVSF